MEAGEGGEEVGPVGRRDGVPRHFAADRPRIQEREQAEGGGDKAERRLRGRYKNRGGIKQ